MAEKKTVMYLGNPVTEEEYIRLAKTDKADFDYLYNLQQEDRQKAASQVEEKKALDAAKIAEQRRKVEELKQNQSRPGAAGMLIAEQQKLKDLESKTVTLPPTLSTSLAVKTPAEQPVVADEKQKIETKIAAEINLPKLQVEEPAVAERKPMKAVVFNPARYQKALDGYIKKYADDKQLTPEQAAAFDIKQGELQTALNAAKRIYTEATTKAKTEAERRDAITQLASIAESFSQAMVKYFAAREGARTGTLLGSRLQFEKYDWQKDLDRSLEKLKADTAEAKTALGLAKEEVETETKQLGEERKTATETREDIARRQLEGSKTVLMEQMRAEQRAAEDYASEFNRALKETAKETESKQKLIDDTKGIVAKTQAQDVKSTALATSRGQLTENYVKLFNPKQQFEIEQEVANTLKSKQSSVRNFFRGIGFASEELTPQEQNIATKALADAIDKRLRPSAVASDATSATRVAPAQQAVQSATVVVELDGRKGEIPREQLDAFLKANPRAKISQ